MVQISYKVEQRIVRFLEPKWNPKMPRRSVICLTDAYVQNLEPRDGRYEVFDATLAGFVFGSAHLEQRRGLCCPGICVEKHGRRSGGTHRWA